MEEDIAEKENLNETRNLSAPAQSNAVSLWLMFILI